MGKRILKIVAIVLASTIGFVGAVFGVMALMGKFKKPIVYPDRLSFAEQESRIVDYGDGASHYFVLNGFANDGQEVNQKSCYLWFDNGVGENLITLQDVEKQPDSEYYLVNCNEPIYYKVNENVTNYANGAEYGKVVLRAKDVRNRVPSSNTQTIRIDRAVTDIYLNNYANLYNNEGEHSQNISLNIDTDLTFANFGSYPENALRPISDLAAKNVQIYYEASKGQDYILVDDNFANATQAQNGDYKFTITKNSNGAYVFKSSAIDTDFTFIIAVFDSYEAEENFVLPNGITNPNDYRVEHMVSTKVTISINNQDVNDVSISKTLNLKLYQNTKFTTNTTDGIGLTMKRDGINVEDRLDELNFDLVSDDNRFLTTGIEFKYGDLKLAFSNGRVSLEGFTDYHQPSYAYTIDGTTLRITDTNLTFTINKNTAKGGLKIGNKEYVAGLTYNEGGNFSCTSGAAFLDGNNFVALKKGSYLEFFKLDENTYEYVAEFEYASTITNENGTRTFNITAINNVSGLYLGVLVVNSESSGNNGNLLVAFTDVHITEVDKPLAFKDGKNISLNIHYQQQGEGYTTTYTTVPFDDILLPNESSYNAFIMITESTNTAVCTINGFNYVEDDVNYSIVGYFEGNKFVNAIKANPNNTNSTTACKVYILQLKNKYQQTALNYLYDILTNPNVCLVYNGQLGAESYTVRATVSANEDGLTISHVYSEGREVDLLSSPQELNTISVDLTKSGKTDTVEFSLTKIEYNKDLAKEGEIITLDGTNVELYTPVQRAYISDPYTDGNINVNLKYNFVSAFVIYEFAADQYLIKNDSGIDVVENTQNHTIKLSAIANDTNLLDMLKKAEITTDNIKILVNGNANISTSNLTITSVSLNEDGEVVITFNTNEASSLNYYEIQIMPNNADAPITIGKINIIQDEPTNIKFKTEDETFDLYDNLSLAQQGSNKLGVEIDYENDYIYKYSINNTELTEKISDILNAQHINNLHFGFVGTPAWAGKNFAISYTLIRDGVRTPVTAADFEQIISAGNFVLEVNIEGLSKYIRVEVNANENFSLTQNESISIFKNEFKLFESGYLSYKYNDIDLKQNVNISGVEINEFGLVYQAPEASEDGAKWDLKLEDGTTFLTISKQDDDWQFTRISNFNVALTITISMDIKTEATPIEMSISFTNPLSVSVNPIYNYSVYKDTTVYLYETRNSTATQFENEALFRITDINQGSNTFTADITITKPDNSTANQTNTLKFDQLGTYKFKIEVNGTSLDTDFEIEVVPNVILANDPIKPLNSNTTYEAAELVTLKAYQTADVTYGQKLGDGTIPLYTDTYLDNLAVDENVTITFSINEDASTSITTDWIEEIGTSISKEVSIYYKSTLLGTKTVTINNKYSVNNNGITLQSLTAKENTITVEGLAEEETSTLYSVVDESGTFTFDVKENNITLNNIITKDYSNINLTFTFKVQSNNLIAKINNVTLTPYIPETTPDVVANTGDEFNIFASLFTDLTLPEQVSSLKLIAVDNQALISNVDDILGTGYFDGQWNRTSARIAEMQQNTTTLTFTFELGFATGENYTFTATITINNKQTIETILPFAGFNAQNLQMAYLTELDALANKTAASNVVQGNGAFVTNSSFEYEPVRLGQTITFDYDEILHLNRAVVKEDGDTNSNFTVEKIGYSTTAKNYFDNNIKISAHTVTFVYNEQFNNGYFAFKLVSTSGYTSYYFVRVQNTKQVNVDITNDVDEVYTNSKQTTFGNVLNDNISSFKLTTSINAKMYLLDAPSDVELDITKNALIDPNATLPTEVTNYATIKVAVVYVSDSTDIAFMFGILNICLKPNNAPTLNDSISQLHGGVDSGEYVYNLTNDFNNPFNQAPSSISLTDVKGADLSENSITLNGNNLIEIDGSTIKVTQFVGSQIKFTANYTFGEIVVKIYFTYNPISLNLEDQFETIGNFDTTNGFNNELDLTEYIGDYTGTVKITNLMVDGSPIAGKYDISTTRQSLGTEIQINEGKKLTFTQSVKDKTITFNLLFENLVTSSGNNIKQFNITLKSGIYVQSTGGANSGVISSQPLLADATNNYSSTAGNKITINKDSSNKYICYTVGGIKIYTSTINATLLVKFVNDENYSANGTNTTVNEQTEILFVHTAETNKVINLSLTLQDDNNNAFVYNGANSQNLFVKLQRTYTKLEAYYPYKGAKHENVAAGGTITITDVFGSVTAQNDIKNETITNSHRLALYVPSGTTEQVCETYDLSAMGFLTESNPNYFKLTQMSYAENNSSTITFNAGVITPTNTTFTFTNNFGAFTYTFRIMPEAKDGVNLLTNEVRYLFNGVEDNNITKYSSITINDVGNTYSLDEIDIGTWQDVTNDVFFIKSITQGTALSDDNVDKNGNYYTITQNNYVLTFRFAENKTISISFKRTGGNKFDQLQYTFILIGNGGEVKLYLYLFNYTVSTVNDGTSTSASLNITAGTSYDLNNQNIFVKSNNGSASSVSPTISLIKKESYYSYLDVKEQHFDEAIKYTLLNNIDNTSTVLNFNSISPSAQATTLTLKYEIKLNNKTLGILTFNITLNSNLQFQVNEERVATYENIYDVNFVLDPKTFPIVDDLSTGSKSTISYSQQDYNKDIKVNICSLDEGSLISSDLRFALDGEYYGVSIANKTLTFANDFNGQLKIIATYRTGAGDDFRLTLNLNVLGVINYRYVGNANTLLNNNAEGFKAGAQVSPISNDNRDNPAISTTNTSAVFESEFSSVNVSYAVQYLILEDRLPIDPQSLFEAGQGITVANPVGSLNNLTLYLPLNSNNRYIVSYKIVVTYLGQTCQALYANYLVINDNIIELEQDVNVNVDSLTGNKLPLFAFSQNYSFTLDGTFNGTAYYNGTNIVMTVSGATTETYNGNYTSTDGKTFVKDSTTLTLIDGSRFSIGEQNGTYTLSENKASQYKHNFNSLPLFKEFVDAAYVQFSNMNNFAATQSDNGKVYFKLQHINNGEFGIDLSAPYSDSGLEQPINLTATNPLFKNSLTFNLEVKLGPNSIVNDVFTFTTNNSITAKGEEKYTLGQIFSAGRFNAEYSNYPVVGVYTNFDANTAKTWVNNATDAQLNSNLVASIDDYKLYQITFTGSGTSEQHIYNIEASYYAIQVSSNSIIVADYQRYGESSYFAVQYPGDGQDAKFDLTNRIVRFYNDDDGTFKKENISSGITVNGATFEGMTITVLSTELAAYKTEHQGATSMDKTYEITYNGITLTINVKYYLQ